MAIEIKGFGRGAAWIVPMMLAGVLATGSLGYAATRASDPVAPAAADSLVKPAPSAAPSVDAVKVTGFRSAQFGMTEADVRAAITKDFALSGDAVKVSENFAEQTHVLAVRVPEVLPNGGGSDVSYVFGYKTKKLIQVSILWSKAIDPATTPERLFSNGNILRAHFLAAGYKTGTVITDAPVKDGLLMFRGADAEGHTTALLLQGSLAAGDNNRQILTPATLLLIYLSDAKNPDVFRLAPGQF